MVSYFTCDVSKGSISIILKVMCIVFKGKVL